MENLHDHRKSYERSALLESEISQHPMLQFREWYNEAAIQSEIREANAMSISVVTDEMIPSTRIVLLKSFNENGFIFFTNYHSNKGKAIEKNPFVCLHFFWDELERQVIIKAKVNKITEQESRDYFNSRPRGSQLGALASNQSEKIPSREFLETKLKNLEEQFEGKEIPKPENWGGYLASPFEIEFWQGRANRLHDRILYKKDGENNWQISRLSP